MVWPLVAMGVGALVQGGTQMAAQQSQMDLQRRASRKQAALGSLFQQSLNNDPLMNTVLGQMQNPGQVFNRRDVFRQASGQIEAALKRRSRDSLKQLAGFGFDADDPQMDFMQNRLERMGIREMGSLNAMLNMAQEQYGAQQALTGAGQLAGGVAGLKQLQVGAL